MSTNFEKNPEDNPQNENSSDYGYPTPPQDNPYLESSSGQTESGSQADNAGNHYANPANQYANQHPAQANVGSQYPAPAYQHSGQPVAGSQYPSHPNAYAPTSPQDAAATKAWWSLGLFGGSILMYIFALFTVVTGFVGLGANIAGLIIGRMAKKEGHPYGGLGFWLNLGMLILAVLGFILIVVFIIFIIAAAGPDFSNYGY